MFKKKSQEGIKKKPTKQEVKAVLERAKKVAEKKEKEDKLDLVLSTLNKYTKKVDRIENILSGKDTEEQKAQTKLTSEKTTTKKQLTNEEKLAQVQAEQEKEKAAGQQQPGQQPGQPQGKLTPEEQKVIGATQQFQQDIGTAQAAQTEAQKAGQQQQPGQILSPQGAWLLERASHAAEIILPSFFQSKGSSSGSSLDGFFKQLGVYQKIESTIMNGFFNFMKNLSPQQRQITMDNIATSAPTPTMTNLPGKSEIIE